MQVTLHIRTNNQKALAFKSPVACERLYLLKQKEVQIKSSSVWTCKIVMTGDREAQGKHRETR